MGKRRRNRFLDMPPDSLDAFISGRVTSPLASFTTEPPDVSRVAGQTIGTPEEIEDDSAVGFGTRVGGSFFRGDQEQEYLRRNLPEGSQFDQRRTAEGEEILYPPDAFPPPEGGLVRGPDGKLRRIDPEGFDVGDIGDVTGYLPEGILGTLGAIKGAALGSAAGPPGTFAGGVGGGTLGSMFGEGIRQGVAEWIDPEVHEFSGSEIGKAGLYGGAGELAPLLVKTLGWAVKQGLKAPGRFFRKGAEGEVPQRVMAAAERAGVERSLLPVSSVTESPLAAGLDTNLRQSALSGGKFTEGDKALTAELESSLGRTREKIGGGFDAEGAESVVSSGIDQGIVSKALIANDKEAAELLSGTIKDAGDTFVESVGQPLGSIEAVTPRLDALAAESAGDLARQPNLSYLPEVAGEKAFFAGAEKSSIQDVMDLRRIAGEMMNRESTRDAGARLYAAVMDDLEESFIEFAAKQPWDQGKHWAVSGNYKKLLDVSRRQFDMQNSPLVQRLFPNGRPNVHQLDLVAESIRAGNVGPEDIRLLKEKIGAGMSEGGITNFSNVLADKASVGLPRTEQGAFIWDQIKQLYLDNALYSVSKHGGDISQGGQTLYNQMFGNPRQARVTRELFGETAGDIENFFTLLRDKNISSNFFRNWSNTAKNVEMTNVIKPSAQNVVGALGKAGLAGQFARAQGGDTILGRQFFQSGDIPDIGAWLHAHRKLAGATRAAGQVGGRELGGRYE